MKTPKLLLLLITFLAAHACAQDKELEALRKQILDDGLFLFRLEKASWIATDIVMHDHSTLSEQIRGYLSYADAADTKTIFWNEEGKVIFTATFAGSDFEKKPVVDIQVRTATQPEADVIALRKRAFDLLVKNDDAFFLFYKNTNPNLIPIIKGDQRTAYILTGAQENKLLIGNDYKISFNSKNEVTKKEKLHNSLITIDPNAQSGIAIGSMHTHVLENQPYMTATDICTYLLYLDFFKFQKHTVVSDKGTSIFEADRQRLILVPQDNSKKK